SNRWLWVLAALTPLATGLSFGTVFIAGGICLTLAYCIWQQRRWRSVLPWLVFSALLLGSFALIFHVNVRVQSADALDTMREFWAAQFPPLANPLAQLAWLVSVHAGDMLSYPVGGLQFQSSLSMLVWLAGLAALARRRHGLLLMLALAPQGLTL